MVQITTGSQLPAKIEREGFSLRNVASVLFRRRWIILAVAVPLIIIGGMNLFGQAGTFTASTKVVVELEKVEIPKWNPNSLKIDYNRVLNTFVQSAMSQPVAYAAAEALKDSIPVMIQIDETLLPLEEEPGLLPGYLLDGLDVSVVGESAILDFRFTSTAPRLSLMAVEALRTAFLEFQVYGRKNDEAVDYYEEQVTAARSRSDSLLALRGEILRSAGYSSLSDEMKYETGRLANLQVQYIDTVVARRTLESEYNEFLKFLDGDPRDFPMGPDQNRSSTLVFSMNTLAEREDELNELLSLYTEDSGQVKRQRALIEESIKNLANEERKFVRGVELALLSLKEKESALFSQIEEVKTQNSNANTIYRQVSLIDSELKANSELMNSLQGKMGEVRMAQFADERVSSTMALSDPTIVSVLTGGTTIVYFVALAFLALALGVIVGFVVENLDHRVYTPRDVEENLNLQVFASVSRAD